MCGIAGIIGCVDQPLMERVLSTVVHRGPDDQGIQSLTGLPGLGAATLGHRRLTIIDLSKRGRQPMTNEDGTIWIVYNGEVYNFAELRHELKRRGHRFQSDTDTEVIIHGFEEWGPRCVDRFVGMFAFAIVDARQGRLVLARDRLGVKPLYYAEAGDAFAFASEIKALLEIPGVPREIDPEGLELYLTLGYVPAPRTVFRGIYKVQPGTLQILENGRLTTTTYWSLPTPHGTPTNADDHAERFRDALQKAVVDRLVSDVPLGSFLSGGLDSSVVTAIMAGNFDRGGRPHTFCIGYDDAEHRHDERAWARASAEYLRTDHKDTACRDEYAIAALPHLVWHMDEPIAEELLAPYARVCELARRDVKVVLSGEGADEFLYGYRYYGLERFRRWGQHLPRSIRRAASRRLVDGGGDLRRRALACCFQDCAGDSFLTWSTFCSAPQRRKLVGPAMSHLVPTIDLGELWSEHFSQNGRDTTDLAPSLDARFRLVDYILLRTDKLSMAVGLEARVPFLDHRLVELLAQVPNAQKIRGVQGKRLLRRVACEWLPEDVVRRRKKPFGGPVEAWLPPLVRRFLKPGMLSTDCILRAGEVAKAVSSGLTDARQHPRLWQLLVLEVWYRLFIRRDPQTLDEARKFRAVYS